MEDKELIDQLKADTVVLADCIKRLILPVIPIGDSWESMVETMHPLLKDAVKRAEALPTKVRYVEKGQINGG